MHVTRSARNHYKMSTSLFSYTGDLIVADYSKVQELTVQMNQDKPEAEHIASSELYAAGLLHEVQHALIDTFNQQEPDFIARALTTLKQTIGSDAYDHTLTNFLNHFPATPIYSNDLSPTAYLETVDISNSATGEEMLILKLSNDNPALTKFSELLDDSELKTTSYETIATGIEKSTADTSSTIEGLKGLTLSEILRKPMEVSPDSLEGQLRFIEKSYAPHLNQKFQSLFQQVLLSLDLFKEEFTSHISFDSAHAPPPMPAMDEAMLSGRAAGMEEYEHFSSDSVWMPKLVLLAKSTYVWLDQLSKRYQKDISKLDDIPDEELQTFAKQGFTGLWLIGLWERSEASKEIKHRMGNPDAVASAYSLYDYEIAQDLGGQAAYQNLRERAANFGIRLASDMVPNHMGIDSRWVIEHPEWFLQTDDPPYPSYRFQSDNLSRDNRVEIRIEDHYYSKEDASVVFERRDTVTGEVRYIYHGNDGTTMPWNDTAQLNYLDPIVREAIIQTILHVARLFPIIRFDAAMTLAKRHIQRLWFPQPGSGGAIPSRAQHGSMSTQEFEQAVPEEFWREVVDRVAEEVPDTLLLAEAFWMMEGYFVRTLGMHRVYNSAFMHMLAQEDNVKYRQSIKNVLEFEPEILKRYVNFMNNPDEESAATQFGKGDKYFGVAMLMSTLPGLPMFGHGQFEGFEEKYGMEFRRARQNETIDQGLFEHHNRVIVPLLKQRKLFAEVENFLLYDVYTNDGQVEENIYAYSNRLSDNAALIVFNNQYSQSHGWIKDAFGQQQSILRGLGIDTQKGGFLKTKELVTGLEYLYPITVLDTQGWYFELGPYDYRCYWEVEQVFNSDKENYSKLHEIIGFTGITSINTRLRDIHYAPLQQAFIDLLKSSKNRALDIDTAHQKFILEVEQLANISSNKKELDLNTTFELQDNIHLPLEVQLAYLVLNQYTIGDIEEWRCLECSAEVLSFEDVSLLKILLSGVMADSIIKVVDGGVANFVVGAWVELLFASPLVKQYLRINEHEGITYYHKESLEKLCDVLVWLSNLYPEQYKSKATIAQKIKSAIAISEYRVDVLLDKIHRQE